MSVRQLKDLLSSKERKVEGVSLHPGDRWPVGRVTGFSFLDCDFQLVRFGGGLSRPIFEHCRFEQTLFGGGRWRGVRFVDCEFIETRVGQETLSSWEGCLFERVQWTGGAISLTTLDRCSLEAMDLRDTTIEEVTFKVSKLRNVVIGGVMRTVLFDGCTFDGFDFSKATIKELTILDEEISGDFLGPRNTQAFILRELGFLDRWVDLVKSEIGGEEAKALNEDVQFLRRTGSTLCIDEGSLEAVSKEMRERVMAIAVRELQR